MKVRRGFVSNSSSSSFTCQVCGEVNSGWDADIEDMGMVQCINGHTMCTGHVLDKDDFKEWLEKREELNDEESDKYDEDGYYEYFYEMPPKLCPVCGLTTFGDNDVLRYCLVHLNTTRGQIEEDLRGQFDSLGELREWLKERE